METTLTKILFISILFSAAIPSILFSSEEQRCVKQALVISNGSLPILIEALNKRDVRALRKLVRNEIKVDDSKKNDHEELSLCLFMKWPKLLKMLIKKDGDLVNRVDFEGRTPLQHAVSLDDSEIVDILIENGAEVNSRGGKGCIDDKTPLQILLAQPRSETSLQINFEKIEKSLRKKGAHC